MAEAAGALPLLPGLPDEITLWEILVRLPPKPLLRSRAVCPAWRRATSAHDFLLAHHARQPSLPLLYSYHFIGDDVESLDVIPFDHKAGVAAADQLQSVARLSLTYGCLQASCDGLLVVSTRDRNFSVCNPATRQYAPLQQLYGFMLFGMYPHSPTGEYRLLLYWNKNLRYENLASDRQDGFYVFALGSGQPPRHTGYADAGKLMSNRPILFHGSLHWYIEQDESAIKVLMAFDTTAESFRQMRAPLLPYPTHLFEIDGMLSMSSFSEATNTTIDIWMAQDYDSEVWALKYQVELPFADLTVQFGKFVNYWNLAVASRDGDVFMLVRCGEWLLQVDIDGKLIANFHCRGLVPTEHRLKQTLVKHTFFPTLEGYVVNDSPFI